MPEKKKDKRCIDCDFCQACSKSRCRLCRDNKTSRQGQGLARCFTYEEYLKWKQKRAPQKEPDR